MARLLLFDVDGTLVSAGGAGRRAIERALAEQFGPLHAPRLAGLGGMRLDGLTDRLIVRLVMRSLELPFDDQTCDRVLERYVERLAAEIHGPGYRVLPGVPQLLGALAARGALLALCTGNVARGAHIKLARGGIDRFFGFGEEDVNGFAHDGEERERIVEAALRRASAWAGRPVDPREAVVIGDTPRDVEAARALGVPTLAVASGRFSVEELAASGADRVVPSLEEPGLAGLLLDGIGGAR